MQPAPFAWNATTNANTPWNDLKYIGVVRVADANRTVARLTHEDVVFIDSIVYPIDTAGTRYNAMMIYNLPTWMARQIATSINGFDKPANLGRFRHIDRATNTHLTTWSQDGRTEEAVQYVNAVYFFDRIPLYGN